MLAGRAGAQVHAHAAISSSTRLYGMGEEAYEKIGWVTVNKALLNISDNVTEMAMEVEERFGKYRGMDLKTGSETLIKFHGYLQKAYASAIQAGYQQFPY
jgi:hypothetical protein